MPELKCPALHTLLHEISSTLRKHFDNVECEMEPCPDLSASPFDLGSITSLGQLVYIVPNSINSSEACKQIIGGKLLSTTDNFHIISDNKSTFALRISLQHKSTNLPDWRDILKKFFEAKAGNSWEIAYIELGSSNEADVRLLKNASKENKSATQKIPFNVKLWMVPVNRRIVAGTTKMTHTSVNDAPATNGTDEKPKKKKVIKKVLRSALPKTCENNNDPTMVNGVNGIHNEKSSVPEKVVDIHYLTNGTSPPIQINGEAHAKSKNDEKDKVEGGSLKMCNGLNGVDVDTTAKGITNANLNGKCENSEEKASTLVNGDNAITTKTAEISSKLSDTPANHENLLNGSANTVNAILQRVNGEQNKQQNGGIVGKIASMFNSRSQSQESQSSIRDVRRKSDELSEIPTHHFDTNTGRKIPQETLAPIHPSTPPSQKSNEDATSDDDNVSFCSAASAALNSLSSSSKYGDSVSIEIAQNMESPSLDAQENPNLDSAVPLKTDENVSTRRSPNRRTLSLPPPTTVNSRLLNGHCGRILSPISSGSSIHEHHAHEEAEEDDQTLYQCTVDEDASLRPSAERDDSEAYDLMNDLSLREDFSCMSNISGVFQRTFINNRERDLTGRLSVPATSSFSRNNSSVVPSRALSSSRQTTPPQVPRISPQKEMVRGMKTNLPVSVLQQILVRFSYKELGELRRVHPHWDELCGQFLNAGYYQLIETADQLLADCQKKITTEKRLVRVVNVLTSLQVHVLNPVDVLRAAMDEGVLCFPYGFILDKAFELLTQIEKIIQQGCDADIELNCERLAEYSRRAQLHYRRCVEPIAEKRMTEVCKLSAVQRLQRLDSFLVEKNLSKLEKVAEKAKDDVRFEVEQLKQQNQQLKKDNRELKQTCLKLDARVEALERKFKTMARLLQ
ncbi:hypothetical protein DdX_09405 [Ditylenchus destructor]|uniref:F-box domain-containing protein n=1 Tax=Ditylenchus destructor TaxID=166010 RepID=A0AAD4N2K0_9BILA|nr:hypothetical protein DdX_09405 [Ditylenchus destructor]